MNGQLQMNAGGGPVNAPPMNAQSNDVKMELNTYIYDHLLQTKQYDLARDFRASNPVKTKAKGKPNGVNADMDPKDGPRRPDDLPEAEVLPFQGNGSFLTEWWTMFWDLFWTARHRSQNPMAQAYLKNQRLRHQMSTDPKMMMAGKTGMMPRGLNPQQQAAYMQQKMMGQQMQRDASQMEMGGQGPQTPGQSIDNAPSPSKRPRLDNGGFEGAMAGRQPQMTMAANGQLIQNGMNPQQMNSFAQGANGQLKMEGMNGMPPNSMGQGMESADFNGQGMTGGVDNKHALQDYQMQLMLLEQQNKKRLLAAKRDNPEPMAGGGIGGSGQPGGFAAPNMSPSGSRGAGPSPTPNDQIRKVAGTPKMPQTIPGSPMAVENRGDSAPNFDPTNPQMAHGVPQQFFNMNGNHMVRPPSSHPGYPQMTPQMETQMRVHAARTGQPWPPTNPMMAGVAGQPQPQGQPGGPGLPGGQQRPGNMAPPPVPADQNPQQQPPQQPRAQESSPAQTAAPPTPSTKAAQKPKKETAAAKKKNQAKKGSASAATPAADSELPPTPTPSTPNATAQLAKQVAPPAAAAAAGAPTNPQAGAGAQQSMDSSNSALFGGMEDGGMNTTPGFSLDFQGLEGSDVFENFDFDNFLNADGGDMSIDHMSFGDGVEAGNV